MAIKMRRGADADFRPEKMQPGELAVTVDGTRKVYAAFAAGDVKELSSKEDVDKTIASGLQSLETSTNNKLQSLEKKASSAVDKISSENQRVQEELSRYEYYTKTESDLKYTVAPRKEASSANGELKLTDADDGLSYLALQGNSEQYTATGTNLFDVKQLVKTMQGLHPENITLMQDNDGKFMRITNSYWHNAKLYTFVNDITKSYKLGFKARFVSGDIGGTQISIKLKDATVVNTGRVTSQTSYTEASVTIPVGKEVDYMYFTFGSGLGFYDILLDSFYLYPIDVPSSERPTGGYGTPSPEYPSEVKSVGDIPKDSNGVEIRNLLDEVLEDLLIYEDSKDFIYLKLSSNVITGNYAVWSKKTPVSNGLYCRFSKTIIGWGDDGSIQIVAQGVYNGTEGTSYPFNFINSSDLYITFTRTSTSGNEKPSKEMIKAFFETYNIMVTSAAEIDEYRPYIGENNGLVKIESQGINVVNVKDKPAYDAGTNNINIIKWTPQEIILDQKGMGTSYAYADVNLIVGKTYSFYCRAQVVTIDGSPTNGATTIGFRKYPPSGMMYGQTSVARDGTYHDCYSKVELPEDVSLMLYVNSTSSSGENVRLIVKDLMVVEGDRTLQEMKALKYQPYYNKVTWIPLREPLRGITGNDLKLYADKVDKEGHVIQNIYCIEGRDMQYFSTDSSGINTSDNPYKWAYWAPGNVLEAYDGTKSVLCNMLKRGNFNINQTVIANTSAIIFNLPNTLTGLANTETDGTVIFTAIRAWVYTNNPLVYYALNKPIEYQIPAIYIETYDQETNIRCLNKVKPSDMTLDYKIAMSSLIKRLEALEEKTVQEV